MSEYKRNRLCLRIMIFSALMQLAAAGIESYLSGPTELKDSTFQHQRPNLPDWPFGH
jgi:hypothetical protein